MRKPSFDVFTVNKSNFVYIVYVFGFSCGGRLALLRIGDLSEGVSELRNYTNHTNFWFNQMYDIRPVFKYMYNHFCLQNMYSTIQYNKGNVDLSRMLFNIKYANLSLYIIY